ncbi:MAG TPA: PQQ-dependent sugar dehydrogenase, partial [Geminicoccaceae bacterium]
GDPRRFVVEQTGWIRIIDADGRLLEPPFLDLRPRMSLFDPGFDERGVLGIAFHPDFAENQRFYVHYSAPLRDGAPDGWNHTARISEFRIDPDDPNRADPDSERIVLEIDHPMWMHNGGSLAFDHQGYLMISVGDGGLNYDLYGDATPYAQDKDMLLGKILRIDVSGHPYRIPKDNPFVDDDFYRPEVFALGFRNPFRCTIDRGGEGLLFCGDVGQSNYEEAGPVRAGENHGWPIMEGPVCFNMADEWQNIGDDCDRSGLTLPAIAYVNCAYQEDCVGRSVTGGYVYRGDAIPELQGHYVFGDWAAARDEIGPALFVAERAADGSWDWGPLEIAGEPFVNFVLGFGEDAEGELYIMASERTGPDKFGGRVFKVVPASAAAVEVSSVH